MYFERMSFILIIICIFNGSWIIQGMASSSPSKKSKSEQIFYELEQNGVKFPNKFSKDVAYKNFEKHEQNSGHIAKDGESICDLEQRAEKRTDVSNVSGYAVESLEKTGKIISMKRIGGYKYDDKNPKLKRQEWE